MAKPEKAKKQYFYIINVKLRNKHTKADLEPLAYEKLFRRLWRSKIHKESSPQKHCIIKACREEKEEGEFFFFSGLLAQFTFIEGESWFNADSLEVVDDFQIPDNYFPDLVLTEYIFVPAAHRFAFYTNSQIAISPYPVKNFLEMALDAVTESNEIVEVDVETSNDGIQQILNAMVIKKIKMDVNYSNFDIGTDVKKFFEDSLRDSNTANMTIIATAKEDNSIEIDKSPILQGALATVQSNGDAEARIIDEHGRLKTVKTHDYPRKEDIFGVPTRFPQLAYEKIMNIFRNK